MELAAEECYKIPILPQPSLWLTKLLNLQAEILYNCLSSLLSPIFSLFSLPSDSYHCAEAAKVRPDTVVHHGTAAGGIPSTVSQSGRLLLRKLGVGLLGATYVCIVLLAVLVAAVILGVGLVQFVVEEPVFVRERLYFDYAEVHPNAVLVFGGSSGTKKKMGVPVGQTIYVSLVLLMPESDYNRETGMFQLVAEVISTDGNVIDKSSQPSMLRYRSLPVRLMRTFLTSIPLLLGITSETQRLTIPVLRHKEGYPRTKAIRITLVPRAGTSFLPQLYEAEIHVNSELPWRKELIHNWKWTFYVWTCVYMYIMLLIVLICCFRPLILPVMTASFSHHKYDRDTTTESPRERLAGSGEAREYSETLRRWKESARKRKAMLEGFLPKTVSSSASSISVTRDDSCTSVTRDDSCTTVEDIGDSESVCFNG